MRNRHGSASKGADYPVLTLDLVSGFQKLAGRLLAQDECKARAFEQESGIGLTALKLPDAKRPRRFGKVRCKIMVQCRFIEPVRHQWINKRGHDQETISPPSATRTCPVT